MIVVRSGSASDRFVGWYTRLRGTRWSRGHGLLSDQHDHHGGVPGNLSQIPARPWCELPLESLGSLAYCRLSFTSVHSAQAEVLLQIQIPKFGDRLTHRSTGLLKSFMI
jgi:hypothetical protein